MFNTHLNTPLSFYAGHSLKIYVLHAHYEQYHGRKLSQEKRYTHPLTTTLEEDDVSHGLELPGHDRNMGELATMCGSHI